MFETDYEAGRSSDILPYILNGQKNIELRLAKGQYLSYKPGDLISVREDFYDSENMLDHSVSNQAIFRVTEVRSYPSFKDLFEREGLDRTLPWVKSIDEGIQVCRRFYSEADEAELGVLAIEFELVRGRPETDNTLMQIDELKFFTDGGSRGNPGPSASGIAILDMDDNVVEAFGKYLGETTNNVAEWTAVKLALEAVAKYKPKRIHAFMDSELVCKQLNGQYRVKHPNLKPIYAEVVALAKLYDVEFKHVYRENNTLADEQVNIAIDAVAGRSNHSY